MAAGPAREARRDAAPGDGERRLEFRGDVVHPGDQVDEIGERDHTTLKLAHSSIHLTAQTPETGAHATPVRQLDGAGVAHDDVGNGAATVDQHPHLASGLGREGSQRPHEVLGDQALGGNPTSREALELADLAGFQTMRIAEYLDELASSWRAASGKDRGHRGCGRAIAPRGRRSSCGFPRVRRLASARLGPGVS